MSKERKEDNFKFLCHTNLLQKYASMTWKHAFSLDPLTGIILPSIDIW